MQVEDFRRVRARGGARKQNTNRGPSDSMDYMYKDTMDQPDEKSTNKHVSSIGTSGMIVQESLFLDLPTHWLST